MTNYVALLRAVNLGKTRKAPMAELRELATDLGYGKVRTHLQSGNLLFTSDEPAECIVKTLESALRDQFGFEIPVILRTAVEMQKVASEHPFGKEEDPTKLHVVFYSEAPPAEAFESVLARDIAPERVAVIGREAYVHYPDGAGRSKLNLGPLGPGTARNWRVVQALAEKLNSG